MELGVGIKSIMDICNNSHIGYNRMCIVYTLVS